MQKCKCLCYVFLKDVASFILVGELNESSLATLHISCTVLFKNNHSKATLQDVPKEAFFTADILKHNDISSGSLPFKCPSKP